MNYTTTALEDWVTNWYKHNRIMTPNELMDLKHIALRHDIFLHKKPIKARFDLVGRYKGIILDSRESIEIQREQFFHELCHILRHCGHQSMMPEAFRQLQEWDARHFTLYAALPSHMIENYDFNETSIVEILAEDFKVRKELVVERLEKIYRNQRYQNKKFYSEKLVYA
ncbi:ImmA/IrrE family metallo-endopeptidase [Gracilibacillus dipsosauri]|uniref:ImmA/IrrE family metallo-endopeptidase n=1 Tax=Gracilibacillus dipsosauri TaxID=178340 RepID=UPI002408FBF6